MVRSVSSQRRGIARLNSTLFAFRLHFNAARVDIPIDLHIGSGRFDVDDSLFSLASR
jgi:hypothetical protein